jgi:hypothetical protein
VKVDLDRISIRVETRIEKIRYGRKVRSERYRVSYSAYISRFKFFICAQSAQVSRFIAGEGSRGVERTNDTVAEAYA